MPALVLLIMFEDEQQYQYLLEMDELFITIAGELLIKLEDALVIMFEDVDLRTVV